MTPGDALFDPISCSFQPIVDATARRVVAYEALVRGTANQPASWIFSRVEPTSRYAFDQHCRTTAIAVASRLGLNTALHLNFLPGGLDEQGTPIRQTLAAVLAQGLRPRQVTIEVTETEIIKDASRFAAILDRHRDLGMRFAIDDFGAGHSGLNLLTEFQPDVVKLDMNLIRHVERHGPRQAVVRAIVSVCEDLGIEVIAEGIETGAELVWCQNAGISVFQGFWFAPPGFEALPSVEGFVTPLTNSPALSTKRSRWSARSRG